jgi:hypothetical protein
LRITKHVALFFGRFDVVGRSEIGLLVSSTRLNRTNDRLSARFDPDVPDADIPWMIAAKALERIDELGYDRCAL